MEKPPKVHAGDVLLEKFLKPMVITACRLSKDLNNPPTRISGIGLFFLHFFILL